MDERTKQLLTLGREHYEKREFERAEHYLRQVLERNVSFADVHNMLGVIHHDHGKFSEAQAAFEEALAVNPNYTEAALNLAVTYNDLGRYEDSKRIYRAALSYGQASPGQVDPFVKGKIANLHADVAQAYGDAGMVSEAADELRKAVALCPDFADLRLRLANILRQQGQLEAAEQELLETLEQKPEYVQAHLALGLTRLAAGDAEAAISSWERALTHDEGNKAAQMYLRMARNPPSTDRPPAPAAGDDEKALAAIASAAANEPGGQNG